MAKATILDRLAGAMKTLGKREGKALTPRQRVAAAQRWNSLADIGESYVDNFPSDVTWRLSDDEAEQWHDAIMDAKQIGILEGPSMYDYNRAPNPFLSKIPAKYDEQTGFLAWCRDHHIPPTPVSLKQYRWETYQTLPYRERQWIANKDDIIQGVRDEGFVSPYTEFNDLRTLQDLDDAALDYTGSKYDFMELPTYKSYEEFPDDFDYMWRY